MIFALVARRVYPCFSVAGNRQRAVERGAGRQMRMQDSFSDDFVSAVDVFKKALAVKKRRSMKGRRRIFGHACGHAIILAVIISTLGWYRRQFT